jgi:hypothetical protein
MKRKRSSWSKRAEREHERQEREIAEHKRNARSESEDRRENIKRLSKECIGLPKRRDFDELLDELEKLTDKYGSLSDRLRSLHQLAELQDREIEYLTQFRRDWELIEAHYSKELENLYSASLMALMQQASPYLPKRKPKQEWEHKRRAEYQLPGGVGLIEYEFGRAGEADWRRLRSLSSFPYEPTCLDSLFAGDAVKMHGSEGEMFFIGDPHPHRILKAGLRRLFGMHRNRLLEILRDRCPKKLPSFKMGRERSYDFRAVTTIMEALLNEEPPEGKKPARGRLQRQWPSPKLKTRVLRGIKARINSLSVPEQIKPHIKAEFLAVVHRHLRDSAKK